MHCIEENKYDINNTRAYMANDEKGDEKGDENS